jgi:diacylglycerol kinase family enzyme
MDVGQVNGKPFLNVAGVGFDALVGWAFHKAGREGGRRGIFTYVRMSLRLLSLYSAPAVTLTMEGERVEAKPFVMAFANGPQYGAGAVLNPGARLNDGRFEIVIFEDGPFLGLLARAPRLFLGGLERSRRYRRIVVERAELTAAVGIEHHRDGEPEPEATRLEVSLLRKALRVVVPKETAEDPAGPFLPG